MVLADILRLSLEIKGAGTFHSDCVFYQKWVKISLDPLNKRSQISPKPFHSLITTSQLLLNLCLCPTPIQRLYSNLMHFRPMLYLLSHLEPFMRCLLEMLVDYLHEAKSIGVFYVTEFGQLFCMNLFTEEPGTVNDPVPPLILMLGTWCLFQLLYKVFLQKR